MMSHQIKATLEKLEIDDSHKEKIKEYAIALYNSLNSKKQKSFFKDVQLARFIGKELEREMKNRVGNKQ